MRSCEYHRSASFKPGKHEARYTSLVPFAVFAWPEQQRLLTLTEWLQFLREFLWSASENQEMLPAPLGRLKLPLFDTQRCVTDSEMCSQDERPSSVQL